MSYNHSKYIYYKFIAISEPTIISNFKGGSCLNSCVSRFFVFHFYLSLSILLPSLGLSVVNIHQAHHQSYHLSIQNSFYSVSAFSIHNVGNYDVAIVGIPYDSGASNRWKIWD